jgi:hypothetical protein
VDWVVKPGYNIHMINLGISALLGFIFIGFGIFCGAMAYQITRGHLSAGQSSRRSRTWPACQGTVSSARLVHSGTRAGWKPKIKYSYQVNGVEYTGEKVTFDYLDSYLRKEAQAVIEKYPEHSTVQVLYNPQQPGEAVLEQNLRSAGIWNYLPPIILLLPTLFCIATGVVGLVSAINKLNP